MDLSTEFRAQFDRMIDQVKKNVYKTVCHEIDVQASSLFQLFNAELNKCLLKQLMGGQSGNPSVQSGSSSGGMHDNTYKTSKDQQNPNNQIWNNNNNLMPNHRHHNNNNATTNYHQQSNGPTILDIAMDSITDANSTFQPNSLIHPEPNQAENNANLETLDDDDDFGGDNTGWSSGGETEAEVEVQLHEPESSRKSKRGAKRKHPSKERGRNSVKFFKTLNLTCIVDGCHLTFANISLMNQHMANDHQILRCRCLGCGQSFKLTKQLSAHIREAHPDNQWQCLKCNLDFKEYVILYNHVHSTHHQGMFCCVRDQCQFTANTRVEMMQHHKDSHRDYRCQYCSKSFGMPALLRAHERIHSKAKHFRCKWTGCKAEAAQHSGLIRHVRMKHFGLPATMKEQEQKGIVDERDPRQFVQIVKDL